MKCEVMKNNWLLLPVFLVSIVVGGVCNDAAAGMVDSQESGLNSAVDWRATELRRIEAICDQEVIKNQLERIGLTAEEAKTRLAKLSDSELRLIAKRLDQVQAGGQMAYPDEPLYKRFGFWILWALVIIGILALFIGIERNVN